METQERPDQDMLDRLHQDPDNWKWGIFYYNKKDKRVFPPKRWKTMGWTVNFANPYSILTFLGIIALTIFIATYLSKPNI